MRLAALLVVLCGVSAGADLFRPEALARSSPRFLWPNGVIPYVIDEALPEQSRVTEAIAHWEENTPIRLIRRTDQANYVRFVRQSGSCSSLVGMIGGEQSVNLDDGCTKGSTVHEIGHVVGLFHEHARHDRDLYVRVMPQEADKREFGNLQQILAGADDFGFYDYGSVMHYTGLVFARTARPPIESIPPGIPVGRTEVLSAADIDAVKRLYGVPVEGITITTFPPGLQLDVDGERITAPRTFSWEPGSRHTISTPETQTSGNTRHMFARWNDGLPRTHTIVASTDQTVYTANFIRQYRITVLVSAAGGGDAVVETPSQGLWFTEDSEVQIRANPRDGFKFYAWGGFGQFGLHGQSPNPLRFRAISAELRYGALFTQGPVTTITSEPSGLRFTVDGTAVTTPSSFAFAQGTTHTIEVADTTQFSAGGTTRHTFTGWSNDGARSQTITVAGDATYTARFKTEHQLVILPPQSGNRVVATPGSNGGWYEEGSTVTVRAEPVAGFRHTSWSFDATGTENPVAIVMDEQKLVSAGFAMPRQISALGNGANFLFQDGIAPGSIIAITGLDIGPENTIGSRVNSAGAIETNLEGYRVLFDEFAAPILYLTKQQIGVVVPYGIAGRAEVILRVIGPAPSTTPVRVPVIPVNPAIFTADASGRGQAAALNQNGLLNSAQNPAAKGSVVVVYATGEGTTTPASIDGRIASGTTLPRPILPVKAQVAGQTARVLYAGAAPGLVAGVMQLNIEVPPDTPSGPALVRFQVGNTRTVNNVTIAVQ